MTDSGTIARSREATTPTPEIIDDPLRVGAPVQPVPLFKVAMAESAPDAVAAVLRSGYIGQGPKAAEFEALISARLGHDRVLTLNSATSGLHLALHLLRGQAAADGQPVLQDGDEVLTTPLTCTATNWPILANRLNLVWTDVDAATCNIDLDDLERKLTPKTRAVMIVHWGGYPVDLARLAEILDRAEARIGHRPVVIEDCAHAFGSTFRGQPLGNHGNFSVFSLQAIKHLTAGDGGILVSPTESLHSRARLLRWYGIDRENPTRTDFRCEEDIAEWGFKFHMNDIAASIAIENLTIVDTVVARHQANAAFYDEQLGGLDGIELMERAPDRTSAFWIYTLKVDRRDDFMRKLQSAGISSSRVHERNDIHSCTREFAADLPVLGPLVDRMICIPNGWWLTEAQGAHVVDTIRSGW